VVGDFTFAATGIASRLYSTSAACLLQMVMVSVSISQTLNMEIKFQIGSFVGKFCLVVKIPG